MSEWSHTKCFGMEAHYWPGLRSVGIEVVWYYGFPRRQAEAMQKKLSEALLEFHQQTGIKFPTLDLRIVKNYLRKERMAGTYIGIEGGPAITLVWMKHSPKYGWPLAHELGHALNDLLSKYNSRKWCKISAPVVAVFRKTRTHKNEKDKAWRTSQEIFARCFECYVWSKFPAWRKVKLTNLRCRKSELSAITNAMEKLVRRHFKKENK